LELSREQLEALKRHHAERMHNVTAPEIMRTMSFVGWMRDELDAFEEVEMAARALEEAGRG